MVTLTWGSSPGALTSVTITTFGTCLPVQNSPRRRQTAISVEQDEEPVGNAPKKPKATKATNDLRGHNKSGRKSLPNQFNLTQHIHVVAEAIQQMYPEDVQEENKYYMKVKLGTPPDISLFASRRMDLPANWETIDAFFDADNVVPQGDVPEAHAVMSLHTQAEEVLTDFFKSVMENVPGRKCVSVTTIRLVRVGNCSQRWHLDIDQVERPHDAGFSFLWQLHLDRKFEYNVDGDSTVVSLKPGDLGLSSFALKHRGVATIDTRGAIACHGYVTLRYVPEGYVATPCLMEGHIYLMDAVRTA